MAEQDQFDEFLGGSQRLPDTIHVMRLVSARASEVAAMTHSIENPQQTKLIFQKLPVYMRRRVMSHNAKRLPRRLQQAHLNQMTKSGLAPKSKRPSRRYRRRPQNLLAEYNRRQRNKIWLETHIWHAKRFHMTEKWGYRLANFANDKCFKANYRAVAKHCLMQDISYYTCIEINGPKEFLKETLKSHCNPLQLTFAANIFIRGLREGTVMFFKRNGYPHFPIGRVNFIWKPNQSNEQTIWIWVHPSFFNDFIKEIVISFQFQLKKDPHLYINNKHCSMTIHKNTLNRFSFYGPSTLNVLTNVFQLPSLDKNLSLNSNGMQLEGAKIDCEEEYQRPDKSWYKEYYNNQENITSFKTQEQLWQQLKTLESPSQLPPHIVLGFTVLDPRFHIPDRRTKPQRYANTNEMIVMPPANANSSPIWEQDIQQKVSQSCMSTHAINKIRTKCLVPGISNDKYFNEDIMAKIPILLIQKPGVGNTGLCSGIDIIFPSNWAMPFWLSCVLRCVRVGALRETQSIAFEYGNMQSPDINDPDTPAYAREALSTMLQLKEKYFRYPPNRRVNFIKLGISSPFFCEWKILMKEWADTEELFVLRNCRLLKLLHENLSVIKNGRNKTKSSIPDLNIQDTFQDKNCLIGVKISMIQKGCPKKFAIICIPNEEDIEKSKSNKNWPGPVEKLNADLNESIRKTARRNHLATLKRLQRQRIRHKKTLFNKLNKSFQKESQGFDYQAEFKKLRQISRDAVCNQSKKMSQLYLPDCCNVRHSCDRQIMGYITTGDFAFSKAKGVGFGYITLNSLFELINKNYPFVLVRNIQTRQYRIAKMDIII